MIERRINEERRKVKAHYNPPVRGHQLYYFVVITLFALMFGAVDFAVDFSDKTITTIEYLTAYHLVKDHADGK